MTLFIYIFVNASNDIVTNIHTTSNDINIKKYIAVYTAFFFHCDYVQCVIFKVSMKIVVHSLYIHSAQYMTIFCEH